MHTSLLVHIAPYQSCHVYFTMPIMYGFFKWQNHDADWIILMFNADLHSHVEKSESLLAGAIDR